ncbi:hypothetical protein TVAG_265290 [Trichomonas vaginalis G3]|uniref:Glycosyltransferase n=1 Tax=Trichomonas vaginalis (strain ATCC PRA-98 / G3) TaxID=412133 RepID=A2G2M8_TRIV3|nr:hypothetical protein TVAGG3_0599510 [Trichomonas vaginalis G3]EAX88589.1 hypothetical protein TVAG_265290 [Trichomonas vaginalis G3]KAI5523835.1 hypothetical protein TVAGG3_0599510 [Trichomonas vaginalis G3]|eukprot:XP_001301519.1 hypothetical protein [Trichomonas vaginalis G3]
MDFNLSITFCAVPYPVTTKELYNLYLITMSSWLTTSHLSKLLILLPQEEFDPNNTIVPELERHFGKNRIFFTEPIDVDSDGVPYIDDWFFKGFDYSQTDYVCWINSDIILPKGWYPRCQFVMDYFYQKNLQAAVISRRCDFNYSLKQKTQIPIDYDSIAKDRHTHSTWGIDFFLISKKPMQLNIDEIPPFHMGKYRWDPWVAGWLDSHIALTSLGDGFCSYHFNHKPKNRHISDPKVKENYVLAARHNRYSHSNAKAAYKIKKNHLQYKNKILTSFGKEMPLDNAPADYNSRSD